jgi:hypothetical protein
VHILLAALVVLAAATPAPRVRHLERVAGIDPALCLSIARDERPPDSTRCPGFVVDAVASAVATCREAGGSLAPSGAAAFWGVDVDGDGEKELTFALEGTVSCEGAWSVFSCGSLGCPVGLYRRGGTGWDLIATLPEGSEESVEVLGPRPGSSYGTLRIGCAGAGPCVEESYLEWTGERYEPAYLMVRGFRVVPGEAGGRLRLLVSETAILATPASGAPVLARYPAGTEVVVVGTTKDGEFLYVSPCNACESGFVPRVP